MSIVSLSLDNSLPSECRGGTITLGNFDGVHRGHLALLAEAVRQAKAVGGPAVAVTFDPHPFQILRPQIFQPLLTTLEQRAELLSRNGADHVVILQTTSSLLELLPAEFFARVILGKFEARAIVEGFNFGFGKDRAGTVETLQELAGAAGVTVSLVPALEIDSKPVSSSRVRKELLAGNVEHARTLLGRLFQVIGTVVEGQRRGQSLGFPTANLDNIGTIIPAEGVYAARVRLADGIHPAAVNIGTNPTFDEATAKVEVHILDFSGDLYGQRIAADFLQRLRDTRRFSSVAELKKQLETDIAKTRAIHQGEPRA